MRLADDAVVHAATVCAGCGIPDLLFGLAAAPSDQAAATRFSTFLLLLLLQLVFVAAVAGGDTAGRTGRRGRRRIIVHASRRLGVTDVCAGPALQRTRRLVFRSVQLPGHYQQGFE